MTQIAIIPARGGSKRLKRKNILPVLGRPMLSYPIEAALKTNRFDRVIVSTEDEEIKQAALGAGAEVMGRHDRLAQDRSTVVQVCLDVLGRLDAQGVIPDWVCCIYATALFITPGDLTASFALRKNVPGVNSIMGVSEFNLQPMQALAGDAKGFLNPKWPEYKIQSQFHPDLVASNGTLYWVETRAFLKQQTFYTDRLVGYKIPWIRAIDLDTPEDYEMAQKIAPLFLNGPDD